MRRVLRSLVIIPLLMAGLLTAILYLAFDALGARTDE